MKHHLVTEVFLVIQVMAAVVCVACVCVCVCVSCTGKSCGVLNAPSYGKIVQSQLGNVTNKTAAGSVDGLFEQSVTIGCDNGYRLQSARHNRYTCADSGQWTVVREHPRCVRK